MNLHSVSTNGVTANFMFFDRGTVWVPNLSKPVNFAYHFAQSVEDHYFCSDHVSVDPICLPPRHDRLHGLLLQEGREGLQECDGGIMFYDIILLLIYCTIKNILHCNIVRMLLLLLLLLVLLLLLLLLRTSGGTTCLTLPVQHMLSSKLPIM